MPKNRPHSNPQRNHPTIKQESYWLYGLHAVSAALANPVRTCNRVLVTKEAQKTLSERKIHITPDPEIVQRTALNDLLGRDCVHQGIAANVRPLPHRTMEDAIRDADEEAKQRALWVMVDQGTDPRNAGAIMRTIHAFSANGLIIGERYAPATTGAFAKAASGAMEYIPIIRVTNLARSLDHAQKKGFWIVGMDGRGEACITDFEWPERTILIIGAEGAGLRRLIKEHTDFLLRIPITPAGDSLNQSNAAAIALYDWRMKA